MKFLKMNTAKQLMKRYMVSVRAPKRSLNSGNSFYITLPEMPENHVPNIGLMPVLNKFPKFQDINALAVYFDMGKACLDFEQEIEDIVNRIEESGNEMKFDEVMQEIDKSKVYLNTIEGLLNVLHLVSQPDFSEKMLKKLSQRFKIAFTGPLRSETLYDYFKHIQRKEQLTPVQKRIIKYYINGAELEGLNLNESKKENLLRGNARMGHFIKQYLLFIDLQNEAYFKEITDKKIMEEFPSVYKNLMCDYGCDPNEGPWVVNMDPLLMKNFFIYCPDAELRSTCWKAVVSRSTIFTNPKYKNSSNIEDIRGFRRQQAQMRGKSTHVDTIMTTQMADSSENVLDVLKSIAVIVRPAYENELDSLIELATSRGQKKEFEICDISYWRRQQHNDIIGLPNAEVMMYFPFGHVWSEVISWCSEVFGVNMKKVTATEKSHLWHENVSLYEMTDGDGTSLGFFYFDPLMRQSKQFSMYDTFQFVPIRPRSQIGSVPLAAIIGGMANLNSDNQYILSMNNLVQLFKMVGFLMQEMSSTGQYCDITGSRGMEYDVVSVAPHLFSNWLRNPEFLQRLSKHSITKKPLGDDLAIKLSNSMSHLAAHDISQELMISHIDQLLYSTKMFWLDILRDTWKYYQPLRLDIKNQFLCSCPELITSSMCGGYYSHVWGKILAADLYTSFTECPKEDIPAMGKRYRETFLRMGGAGNPHEMFNEFRGRDPDVNAITSLNNIPSLN